MALTDDACTALEQTVDTMITLYRHNRKIYEDKFIINMSTT